MYDFDEIDTPVGTDPLRDTSAPEFWMDEE